MRFNTFLFYVKQKTFLVTDLNKRGWSNKYPPIFILCEGIICFTVRQDMVIEYTTDLNNDTNIRGRRENLISRPNFIV